MPAPQELRKKARRFTKLAADLTREEDVEALRDLAAQLEQQADDAEESRLAQASPLH